MRLHSQFRQCVAFLRVEGENAKTGAFELQERATAFFVQVPLTRNAVQPYVVTAAHVVQKARAISKPLVLRVNTVGAGWEDMPIPDEAWVEHRQSDVAIAELDLANEVHDVALVPTSILLDDESVARYDIGEGDEIFMPGLFTSFPGEARDEPIVRFGHIALGRQEALPLRMPSGKTRMAGYLIEARSWGGHSGSPVFVSFEGPQGDAPPREGQARLVGLIHGHYEGDAEQLAADYDDEDSAAINAGIAVVMPAQAILDVLMEDGCVKRRDEESARIDDARPTPDTDATPDAPASGDEFERFEALTKQLVNTPKPEK